MTHKHLYSTLIMLSLTLLFSSAANAQRPTDASCVTNDAHPRALIAGDSWAQYMWDDASHNDIFDKFGHAEKGMIGRSRGSDPGPGYAGDEYAISGSEARQWADSVNYPYIANVIAELNANPTIDTVLFSIGGNDVLAGKSGGGYYKDMDLDVVGSQAALLDSIEQNTLTAIAAFQAVDPTVDILLSSYDFPNFDVEFGTCWIYACPKRRDLSRDPTSDLITNAELNAMISTLENRRKGWANGDSRLYYDNAVGLMHHYYGDGDSRPGVLPKPGTTPPTYAPLPGGNPALPTRRAQFRIFGDPIHLDYDAYQYKITHQTEAYFFPKFRGDVTETFFSQGGLNDGWTNGTTVSNSDIVVGEDGGVLRVGLVSFDTSAIPAGAAITGASLYLIRGSGSGVSPFESADLGSPTLDIASGSFGLPEVEEADLAAAADAADAGCFYGTAKDTFYAVRVDLTTAGLAAINTDGLTQFRIAFPQAGLGNPTVNFFDGDATLLRAENRLIEVTKTIEVLQPDGSITLEEITYLAIQHQGLGEVMGTTAPFLDVNYTIPTAITTATDSATVPSLGMRLSVLALCVVTLLSLGARLPDEIASDQSDCILRPHSGKSTL
jgi:hypothetical protein